MGSILLRRDKDIKPECRKTFESFWVKLLEQYTGKEYRGFITP